MRFFSFAEETYSCRFTFHGCRDAEVTGFPEKPGIDTLIHFTTNTFTDKEWGYSDEDPDIFNPPQQNTDQWSQAIKNAGIKGIMLTCKHYDGFCLCPSEHTGYSVNYLKHGDEKGETWIPTEVDVSIRPGWFYHPEQDSLVTNHERLFNIYLSSVGRGANLLLNIPPDRRGLLHENNVHALWGWKKLIDETFASNLALGCKTKASAKHGKSAQFTASKVVDGGKETYWATNDEILQGSIEFGLGKTQLVKYVLRQEYIRLGQRVRKFSIDASKYSSWQQVAQATTIGHKRIIRLKRTKISILIFRKIIHLSN